MRDDEEVAAPAMERLYKVLPGQCFALGRLVITHPISPLFVGTRGGAITPLQLHEPSVRYGTLGELN